MKKYFFLFIAVFVSRIHGVSAITVDDIRSHPAPEGSIITAGATGTGSIEGILSLVETILLKVVLPVVAIGSALYIAYTLLTAEGDETKLKRAWKAVAYSAAGLVAIALSYALVTIIAHLSL